MMRSIRQGAALQRRSSIRASTAPSTCSLATVTLQSFKRREHSAVLFHRSLPLPLHHRLSFSTLSIKPFEELPSTTATTNGETSTQSAVVPGPVAHQNAQNKKTFQRTPIVPHEQSPTRTVSLHIPRPPYASTGMVFYNEHERKNENIWLHSSESAARMRAAAQLAATVLLQAVHMAAAASSSSSSSPLHPTTPRENCDSIIPTTTLTTDDVDAAVHRWICAAGAYPSPLNYCGFPKSVCTSVNEVICHGIPDARPLQFGDVISLDVSCFLNGVHGDNCATVIVGDHPGNYIFDNKTKTSSKLNQYSDSVDWRGVPYATQFDSSDVEAHFVEARRLVAATREALYASIATVRPGSCLSEIGAACQDVADRHGYTSVTNYHGHGIGESFHTAPFVKHFRSTNEYDSDDDCNNNILELREGMIFTIEPMFCQYDAANFSWDDQWTVATTDGGLSAQFEHTVLVTKTGVEVLTLPIHGIDFDKKEWTKLPN